MSNGEVAACAYDRFRQADAELARYVVAARKRLAEEARDDGPGKLARPAFEAAEKAFTKYRDQECGAVADYFRMGSGMVEYQARCLTRLTRLHTHTVWADWLTEPDFGDLGILPEPTVPAGE